MLVSLLALGFLLGLKHALDGDHVAAVAQLAARSASWRQTLRLAAAWGVGHAGTLVLFGAAIVLLGATIPDGVARVLEALVGAMLVYLGANVFLRLRRERIHVHAHRHADEPPHIHLHQHAASLAEHSHPHGANVLTRGLVVGSVHGLAGTAGLVLVAVPTMKSGAGALAYLVVFGAGTVLGMIVFSLLLSVPLTLSLGRLRRSAVFLEGALGVANVILGGWIAYHSLFVG
jgi:cytochrome c biogenesis protein CcdA